VPRFDPTGLVKGWVADRAASRLAELAGASFCLNAGGDVVVAGTAPWRVGIASGSWSVKAPPVSSPLRGTT
jgi:FAD:protein FMN transferase